MNSSADTGKTVCKTGRLTKLQAKLAPPQLARGGVLGAKNTHMYSLRTLSEAGYGSIATLRRAIREGRLDAVRVGGRLKVTAEALARYIGEPISTGGEAR